MTKGSAVDLGYMFSGIPRFGGILEMMKLTRIGRYETKELLGVGGFASVFKAFDPRLEDTVALKVLAENWSQMADVRKRFRSEAVMLRRLQTQYEVSGFVNVFDVDETASGQPFFVMTYADRGTLADRIGRRPLTLDDVLPFVQSMSHSLSLLHQLGYIHRDLKPSNIFFRSNGRVSEPNSSLLQSDERVLVSDLGMAKDLNSQTMSGLSLAGGTPRFMAPEQHEIGSTVDHRVDIYAASILLSLLVTEPTESLRQVLAKGKSEDPANRPPTMEAWYESVVQTRKRPLLLPTHNTTDTSAAPEPCEVNTLPEALVTPETHIAPETSEARVVPEALVTPEAGVGPETYIAPETATVHVAPNTPDSLATEETVAADRGRESTAPQPVENESTPPLGHLRKIAAAAVLAIIALSLLLLLSFGRTDPRIIGPSTIEVGETVVYQADVASDTRIQWTDWNGKTIEDDGLVITAQLPGELSFSLTADGKTSERTITVEASALSPTIVGPTESALGESATFKAELKDGTASHFWIDPTGKRLSTEDLSLTFSSRGDATIILIAVDGDGVERGDRHQIKVSDG